MALLAKKAAAASAAAAALLFLIASSISLVAADAQAPVSFRADDGVIQISGADEFAESISSSRRAACVYFYLPRCPACAQTKTVLLAAANKLEGLATVGAVDCSSTSNQPLCAEHVKVGYPTFRTFSAIPRDNPYTGVPFKEASTIDKQPLLAKHLVEATLAGLPESLVTFAPDLPALESARAEAKSKGLPLAVLFTSKRKAPPLFRAVAAELLGRAAFVAASSGDDAVAESLFGKSSSAEERKAPALFVETLSPSEEKEAMKKQKKAKASSSSSSSSHAARIRHAGPLTAEAMNLFLLPHAISAVEAEGSNDATLSSSSSSSSDDRATPKVVEVISDEASLDAVLSRASATLLAFFDSQGEPGACSAELEAFNSAAVELGPLARAAAIDAHRPSKSKEEEESEKSPSLLLPAPAVEQFLQKPGGGPVDGAAFFDAPCDLQVVGVPAGSGDKGEPDEWTLLSSSSQGGAKKQQKKKTSAAADAADSRPWASSRALSRFITATFPPAAMPVESEQAMAAMMAPPGAPPRTPGPTSPPKLRPVALLFSDKDGAIPPLMHALATNFGPLGFGVGVVPASAEGIRKQFRVEKVPSLVLAYMPPPEMMKKTDPKNPQQPPQGSLAVQGYRGPIRYALIDAWLRMAAPHVGVELPVEATASAAAGLLRGGSGNSGAKKPAAAVDAALPELLRASKPGDLARLCPRESKSLCVIVGLRGGADPEKTRDAEALLAARRVAAAWSGQPLVFCAVDASPSSSSSKAGNGGSNGRAALSSLGVDPDAAPTAVVYSPAKLRSIPMPELDGEPQKLTEKSLNLLLDSVFTGRAVTIPVASRPEIEGEGSDSVGYDDDAENDSISSSTKTIDVEAALKKSLRKESTGSREEL